VHQRRRVWIGQAEQLGELPSEQGDLGQLLLGGAGHGDAEHRGSGAQLLEGQVQAGLGAGAAGGDDDGGRLQFQGIELVDQFQPGADVAEGAQGIGATDGDHLGCAPLLAQALGLGFQLFERIIEGRHRHDLGTEEFEQQAVAAV